jgi:hypothetical protein
MRCRGLGQDLAGKQRDRGCQLAWPVTARARALASMWSRTGLPGAVPAGGEVDGAVPLAGSGRRVAWVRAGYAEFAKTGQTLGWSDVSNIEQAALVRGGMDPAMAAATAEQGIQALKDAGVAGPTRIPWSR